MNVNFPNWVTKPMLKGARTFNLDAYLLALEGWRRGLTLNWYYDMPSEANLKLIGFNPIGKIFSLENNQRKHYFYRSRGDQVSNSSVDITGDKTLTKKVLNEKGIPTPIGFTFDKRDDLESVYDKIENLQTSVVIKPSHGSLGNGVFTKVKTKQEFLYAVKYIWEELGYNDIIVEEFVEGYDVRVYVIEDRVVAATKREPASIMGNGELSILELIEQKNQLRKKNPHLSTRIIKVNQELEEYIYKSGYKLQDILDNGKRLFVSDKANISAGGDSINILNELPEHARQAAIDSIKAIDGLTHAGVDVMVNDNESKILEINSTAGISLHIFPSIGNPTNIEKEIIDYYFPETINVKTNPLLYFNYKDISNMLRNRAVNSLEITNAIVEKELFAKRFIVKGKVQGVGYRAWTRRQASKIELNGYVKNLKNGNVVIVVASDNFDKISEFKQLLYEGPERAIVEKVIEYDWDKQVNIGFEIRY